MILHYKFFKTDKDFELFQTQNKISIKQISPVTDNVSFKFDETYADGDVSFGIFCIFTYDEDVQ